MFALAVVAAGLLAVSLVYCVLVAAAARNFLSQRRPASDRPLPISVLKPLSGADEDLAVNLRSFFEQDRLDFEILFAVRAPDDPAVRVVEALQAEFPRLPARLIITGEPPYPNAKVFSLDSMLAQARYDLLVMSDSDIRIGPGFPRSVSAEFSDPKVALATCPYRAVPGRSLWSRLEAEGMNTEFLAGVLVARFVEGVKFAVGPTVAARKEALRAIGGFAKLKDYLAEDFVMGRFAAAAGLGVILSRNVVAHFIGSESLRANLAHRMRWLRSTRRSRPLGYFGQVFTNPLPLGILLVALHPAWWLALIAAFGFRALAAWATCRWILGIRPHWLLLPIQDLLSFFFWLVGFFGNTIVWRGRRYHLFRDGRFELR